MRKLGVGLAIFLRLALLVILLLAIDKMQDPFFTYGLTLNEDVAHEVHPADTHTLQTADGHPMKNWELNDSGRWLAATFNVHALVVLIGGVFIIYTAFQRDYAHAEYRAWSL